MRSFWLFVGCWLLLTSAPAAEPQIDSSKAGSYVGQKVTVCGNVAGTKKFSKGTYLNLGANYPKQHITVLIWDSDEKGFKDKFGGLNLLQGKRICAVGLVDTYKDSLQIKVSSPNLLALVN